MSESKPEPVESWAPLFTQHFTDEVILRDALSQWNGAWWCKLCDAPVPTGESPDAHRAQHKRELRTYRNRRQKEAERRRLAGLSAANRKKGSE